MLIHGHRITGKEIESITSLWSPEDFVSLCNSVVWASACRQGTILPSFTERVYVRDKGIDAEYVELGNETGNASHLISVGWNVFQYKLRDVLAQKRNIIVTGLKGELKKIDNNKSNRRKAAYKGALKDVYDRKGQRPSTWRLRNIHDRIGGGNKPRRRGHAETSNQSGAE